MSNKLIFVRIMRKKLDCNVQQVNFCPAHEKKLTVKFNKLICCPVHKKLDSDVQQVKFCLIHKKVTYTSFLRIAAISVRQWIPILRLHEPTVQLRGQI